MSDIFEIELPELPDSKNWEEAGKAAPALALAAVASMAKTSWMSLAAERLGSRRRDFEEYSRGIQEPEILPEMATITLVGKRPNEIEFGRASYDLRDVLLNPQHVRIKKRGEDGKGMYRNKRGGVYRPIPFRHAGPDSQGAVGQPMGSPFAHIGAASMPAPDASSLGQYIYKAAKELKASTEASNRKTQWGERLARGMSPKLRPHHVSGLYDSMYRVTKAYKNEKTGKTTNQSKYLTFRTISSSRKVGWIMPATPGYHIMVALQVHMKEHAPALVSSILSPKGP